MLLQSMLDKPAAPGWERESLYEGVGVCVCACVVCVWWKRKSMVLAYSVYQKWDDHDHAFALL